jgi:hypothetical protein
MTTYVLLACNALWTCVDIKFRRNILCTDSGLRTVFLRNVDIYLSPHGETTQKNIIYLTLIDKNLCTVAK